MIAIIGMHSAEHPGRYLETDGTLEYPLGYRNANAAFFLIAFWPALGLAARPAGMWLGRGAALAAATLCLAMGMLSQSRGSMIAGAAALCVYVAFSSDRARRVAWLALAALPALIVLPALTDLYHEANSGTPIHALGGELRSAANAAALSAAVALVIGAAVALVEGRLPSSPRAGKIADRAAIIGLVVALLGGSIAFVATVGDPIHWVSQKASQFQAGEASQPVGRNSRFTFNARTGRGELWRIALVDFGHHPLLGDGAGGYRYTYLKERRPDALPAVNDAHSFELENLAELGIVGFLLLAAAHRHGGDGGDSGPPSRAPTPRGSRSSRSPRAPTGCSTPRSTGSGHIRPSPPRSSRCSARPARRGASAAASASACRPERRQVAFACDRRRGDRARGEVVAPFLSQRYTTTPTRSGGPTPHAPIATSTALARSTR